MDVLRERLEFPELEKAVYAQRERWNADLVVIENAGSGKSLLQNIKHGHRNHWAQGMPAEGSKQDRASKQAPKFERGEVFFPKEAAWLRTLEDELLLFPQAKNDDQVDSVVQFLAAVDTGELLRRVDMARRL